MCTITYVQGGVCFCEEGVVCFCEEAGRMYGICPGGVGGGGGGG